MKIAEVYRRLNSWDPLDWEHHVYETRPLREGLDRKMIGSTTHMCVEAALDRWAFEQRRIEKVAWAIVYSNDRKDDQPRIYDALAKVWLQLRYVETGPTIQVLSETEFSMWGMRDADRTMVYFDHYALNPLERITGPHRLVRAIQRVQHRPDRFLLTDRDSNVVAETNAEGVDRVLSLATCPIYDVRTNRLVTGRLAHTL